MTPDLKKLLEDTYSVLKECMIEGLEKGEMTVADSEASSYLIEKNMNGIESRGELLLFTADLARKYPSYQKGHIVVRQASVAEKDKLKLEALQEKLRSFSHLSATNGS